MEQETSRRGFLGASGIALAAARLSAYQQRPIDSRLFAYVGRHTILESYSGPRVAPSDIRMHPNAKFLYSANRGDDSVAVFAIDEGTGRLTRVEVVKTGGRGPREMNIEPSGKFLFVCNLQSNEVVTFALDGNTGKMTQVAKLSVPQAAVIDFATL